MKLIGQWDYDRMKMLNQAALAAGTFCTLQRGGTLPHGTAKRIGARIRKGLTIWILAELQIGNGPLRGGHYLQVQVNNEATKRALRFDVSKWRADELPTLIQEAMKRYA